MKCSAIFLAVRICLTIKLINTRNFEILYNCYAFSTMSIMLCCKLVEQNQPIASQSTNKGCGQILSFVIEVPVDEVN